MGNSALHRFVGSDAMIFYNAEVAGDLYRLLCDGCCAETCGPKRARNPGAKGRDLVFTLSFFQSSTMETHDLTTKMMAKMPKSSPTAKARRSLAESVKFRGATRPRIATKC